VGAASRSVIAGRDFLNFVQVMGRSEVVPVGTTSPGRAFEQVRTLIWDAVRAWSTPSIAGRTRTATTSLATAGGPAKTSRRETRGDPGPQAVAPMLLSPTGRENIGNSTGAPRISARRRMPSRPSRAPRSGGGLSLLKQKEKPPEPRGSGGWLVQEAERMRRHAVVLDTPNAWRTSATLGARPCFWR
jgi:hypothetical protein